MERLAALSAFCQVSCYSFATIKHPDTGGRFEILVEGERLWERKQDGGFPEIKELKQRVRDRIAPERGLGHTDRAAPASETP